MSDRDDLSALRRMKELHDKQNAALPPDTYDPGMLNALGPESQAATPSGDMRTMAALAMVPNPVTNSVAKGVSEIPGVPGRLAGLFAKYSPKFVGDTMEAASPELHRLLKKLVPSVDGLSSEAAAASVEPGALEGSSAIHTLKTPDSTPVDLSDITPRSSLLRLIK